MLFPRIFTVREANALVPLLDEGFARIAALVERARALRAAARAVASAGGTAADAVPADPLEMTAIEREIEAELVELHRLGVLVKALDPGTVDVWAQRNGEPVLLTWQAGDDGFLHWHEPHEATTTRKAIEADDVFAMRDPC